MRVMPVETLPLAIGSLDNAVLVTGLAYQDPKDALNEFVSNAADEYAEAGQTGERIRVALHRRGRNARVVVEDWGRGLDSDSLRRLASNLFLSAKAGDPRTLGDKAIGILAFQQLGGRCEIVTRATESSTTHALRLRRGSARAELELDERRAPRARPGTTVTIADLDPPVARTLTGRRVASYLRRRRGPALERGEYVLEIVDGDRCEIVAAGDEHDGVPLLLAPRETLWGTIELSLFVTAEPLPHRRVAVVGGAGTTIIDDVAAIDELARYPWTSGHVSGHVTFTALAQTAGRRAIVRDREAFPVFLDTIVGCEPAVLRALRRLARAEAGDLTARVSRAVLGAFGEPTGGLLADRCLDDAATPPLRGVLPDPDPAPGFGDARSRRGDDGIVYYNDRHRDFLAVCDDAPSLLDYLAVLVAREEAVRALPDADPAAVTDEMVRLLMTARRRLPRRR
jgi:hypothetical protein